MKHRKRKGFILLAALAMLAIVGVAILTLGATSAYDGRRTMVRQQRAQLDQMLLAAATDAGQRVGSATPKSNDSWETELPRTLAEQNAKLTTTVESVDENEMWIEVHAQLQNLSSEQSIQFRHASDGWKLINAYAL
jgi:type II secretory pathway pseudopilin PulG